VDKLWTVTSYPQPVDKSDGGRHNANSSRLNNQRGDEMGEGSKHGRTDGRATRDEYLQALEQAALEGDGDGDEKPGVISEAERLAALAEPPRRREDGKPVGTERQRPLTPKQHHFARGLIEGKTQEQAYRDAYPEAQAKPSVIKTSAWKLSQDVRIQTMLNEHWGETVEALADDTAATKRFVLKTLLHYVKEGKQEGSRLKALELMGKTVGMFSKQEERASDEGNLSAEQLKKDLAGHLRLLNNVRPMTRAQVIEADVIEPELIPVTFTR